MNDAVFVAFSGLRGALSIALALDAQRIASNGNHYHDDDDDDQHDNIIML